MLAIIKTGGKQYIVKEGDKLKVEKLDGKVGDKVSLDVLFADGKLGNPNVPGASVEAKILKQAQGDKVLVVKYKPKVRYKKAVGHRQLFTELEIVKISA